MEANDVYEDGSSTSVDGTDPVLATGDRRKQGRFTIVHLPETDPVLVRFEPGLSQKTTLSLTRDPKVRISSICINKVGGSGVSADNRTRSQQWEAQCRHRSAPAQVCNMFLVVALMDENVSEWQHRLRTSTTAFGAALALSPPITTHFQSHNAAATIPHLAQRRKARPRDSSAIPISIY